MRPRLLVALSFAIATLDVGAAEPRRPVATVSIGGARNAGLLAARIVGTSDDDLGRAVRERMSQFQVALRDQAHAKGASLREEVAKGV